MKTKKIPIDDILNEISWSEDRVDLGSYHADVWEALLELGQEDLPDLGIQIVAEHHDTGLKVWWEWFFADGDPGDFGRWPQYCDSVDDAKTTISKALPGIVLTARDAIRHWLDCTHPKDELDFPKQVRDAKSDKWLRVF